ncbi:MAG: glycosyltransferase [Bacteroidota bacterium]
MDVKPKVLYISYDGMTDALGQSQVLPYLRGLSQEYEIHLLSFEKEEPFGRLKHDISALCQSSGIHWHPQHYTKKPPVISTLRDIRRMWKSARKLQLEHGFKIVHCRSYIPGMTGMRLKKDFGVKFLFDMRGFWVDERVDGGQWKLEKPLYRRIYSYFKRKEKELFSSCDQCVSLTENGKQELLTWKLDRKDILPVQVIPCCVDLDHFDYRKVNPEDQAAFREKYRLQPDDLVVCYLGSLSTVYLFDNVLKTLAALEQKYEKLKFLIFTHEAEWVDSYLQRSAIRQRENVIVDSLNRGEVPAALSICDYSIFFCKPSYSRKGTSPTRLAELIACGVKVISNTKVGDSEQYIRENELGYVFEGFEQEDYDSFISGFELRQDFSRQALFDTAEKHFSLEDGIQKYRELYRKLI